MFTGYGGQSKRTLVLRNTFEGCLVPVQRRSDAVPLDNVGDVFLGLRR